MKKIIFVLLVLVFLVGCSKHKLAPDGFVIVRCDKVYTWKMIKNGYISAFEHNSKQDAIDYAWSYKEYRDSQKEKEKEKVWVEVK